jgi:hypothetical protein
LLQVLLEIGAISLSTGKKRSKPVKTGHLDSLRPWVLGDPTMCKELCA